MRRAAYFVLLGPLLSWLVFVAMLTPELLTRPPFENGVQFFIIVLLLCYAPGAIGFLLVAQIDRALSQHRWRVFVSAVVGFAIAYALFYFLSRGLAEKDFAKYEIFLGLMGGLPAAVCSWLAERQIAGRAVGAAPKDTQ